MVQSLQTIKLGMKEIINPLVSIIVVCYNHEKFIVECIESIMHQSYTNIEVLVYDNGSTDNSASILKGLQKKYKYKLYLQENIGVPRVLNQALEESKGKYISPMSTDDYWPLNKIEIAVNFLENCDPKIAVCGGNALRVDKNSNIFRKQTFTNYHELNFKDVFLDGKNIPALTSLIKREVINYIGGYDENIIGEDGPMWLMITYKGYRIAKLNQLMGYHRRHGDNLTEGKEWIAGYVNNIRKYKNHLKYEEALNNKYYRLFKMYVIAEKRYSLQFIKKLKIKHLNTRSFVEIFFRLLLPSRFIKWILRSNLFVINK